MKLDRIFLVLAGVVGVAAFFFPYLNQGYLLNERMAASGYNYIMSALQGFGAVEYAEGQGLMDTLWNFLTSGSGAGYLSIAGVLLVLAGPYIFLLFSLGYILRGLRGKQYRRGIFISLLILGIAWASFYFLSAGSAQILFGESVSTPLNFFGMAGLGFWMAFGSMIAAAFSLFFAKNLD